MTEQTPAASRPKKRHSLWRWLFVALIVVALFRWVVHEDTPSTALPPSTAASSTSAEDSRYTQTWATAYADTTCDQWLGEMTGQQTWAAAADILTSSRNKVDGGSGLPPEALITSFEQDVTEGCSADVPGLKLLDVAYGIYQITGHDQYKP